MSRLEYIEEIGKSRYDMIIEKFNPYHDERGRFTSANGGGMSVSMGVNGSETAGKRTAASGTLSQVEAANRNADHEIATIINPQSGKVIFAKDGSETGVSFNRSERLEVRGNILTHNHTEDVIFSPGDVANSYTLHTIRATTPGGKVYSLSGMNRQDAVYAYQEHYMKVREASFQKMGVRLDSFDKDLTAAQRAESYSIITESCSKWLSDNAGKYGYQYSEEEY